MKVILLLATIIALTSASCGFMQGMSCSGTLSNYWDLCKDQWNQEACLKKVNTDKKCDDCISSFVTAKSAGLKASEPKLESGTCGFMQGMKCSGVLSNYWDLCKDQWNQASCLQKVNKDESCDPCISSFVTAKSAGLKASEPKLEAGTCGFMQGMKCSGVLSNYWDLCKNQWNQASCLQKVNKDESCDPCISSFVSAKSAGLRQVQQQEDDEGSCGLMEILQCTGAVQSVVSECKGHKGSDEWIQCISSALSVTHNENCVSCINKIINA